MSIVPNFTESKRIVIIDGNVPLQPQVRGCRSPSRACPQDWKVELGPLDTLHLMARLRGGFHIRAGDSVTKASETWIWVSLITRVSDISACETDLALEERRISGSS